MSQRRLSSLLEETATGDLVIMTESGVDKLPVDAVSKRSGRTKVVAPKQMKNIERYLAQKPWWRGQ